MRSRSWTAAGLVLTLAVSAVFAQPPDESQLPPISLDQGWTMSFGDPVQLAQEVIAKTQGFWTPIGYGLTVSVYTIGATVAMYGGAYVLLESPKLAVDMVTGGFYKLGASIGEDFILHVIESSVKTPRTICQGLSRTVIKEGLADYAIAYAIARRYLGGTPLSRDDALEFLDRRWGLFKLAIARALYNESRTQDYSVDGLLARKVTEELLQQFDVHYQSYLGIDRALPLTQTAFFIKDVGDILEARRVGLMAYQPYVSFIARVEELNRTRIAEAARFQLGGPVPVDPMSNATILFLLDVSGSMDDPAPGSAVRKIDAAKEALNTALQQLVALPGNEFGLLTFGGSCETELVKDFTSDANAIATAIAPLRPSGGTPIELAIRRGAQLLRDRPSATNLSLILISDGMETCNGDPVQAARELNLQGTGGLSMILNHLAATAYAADQSTPIRFVVIAFDVEPKEQRQLEAIAHAGQGTFHRAENVVQLVQALTKATTEVHYWEGEVGMSTGPGPQPPDVVLVRKGTNPLWYVLGALWVGILSLGAIAVVAARRRQGTHAPVVAAVQVQPSPPEVVWARLVGIGPRGGAWNLSKPVVTLGRSPGNDIVIDDGKTSARHAQIERRAGGAKIIDLGSTNGTLVNGKPVKSAPVVPGDRIKIGETELEYRAG
ncbi:VWA domain-containing protein [Candidatus Fermentibacteria bacterium]|nr:VWA domain-containing protein [Candidatus Fermentibacteria bacterium]